jgi:hypothetical protein
VAAVRREHLEPTHQLERKEKKREERREKRSTSSSAGGADGADDDMAIASVDARGAAWARSARWKASLRACPRGMWSDHAVIAHVAHTVARSILRYHLMITRRLVYSAVSL